MSILCLHFTSKLDEKNFRGFAEACQRFTPWLAWRPRETLFLDLRPTQHLFRQENLRLRLQSLATRFHLPAFTFATDTGDRAHAGLAFLRALLPSGDFPLAALPHFLFPFTPLASQRFQYDLACKLPNTFQKLGFSRLQDILKRSHPERTALLSKTRFASLLPLFLNDFPWPRLHFEETIETTLLACDQETLSATLGQEALLFLSKQALDQITARLRGRNLRLNTLEITLTMEDRGERLIVFHLPVPQGSTHSILPLLRDRFAQEFALRPLRSGVTALRFVVTETSPARNTQRDFFSSHEEQREQWGSLLNRLLTRLDEKAIFFAEGANSYLPERAWSKITPSEEPTSQPSPPSLAPINPRRPTRLLPFPLPIRKLDFGFNAWLESRQIGQRWRTSHWIGPERLSAERWDPAQNWERQYYEVFTEEGPRLWVFQAGHDYFLHGFFD